MQKILILIGSVLALALVAAGGFWAGRQYEADQSERVRAAFMDARGPAEAGQMPGGERPGFPGGEGFLGQMPGAQGGGTVGAVKTVDEAVITLSTAQDVTTVRLSDDTRIEQTVAVTAAELQTGMRVMVTGERDAEGTLIASQIRILSNDPAGLPYPAP